MANFQEKKGFKYIINTKLFLILVGLVIVFFTWNVFGLLNKMNETSNNKKITEQKIQDLQIRKEKLSSDILKLETDKGKEEIFRENYGLAKDGEGVIVIVEDKNQNKIVPEKNGNSFVLFFKNLFK